MLLYLYKIMSFIDLVNNGQRPTAFAIFDNDATFQTEADNMVLFVKRSLGDDVLSVELTSRAIYTKFEQATLRFGSIVNEFEIQSNLANLAGQPTGSNIQNLYPKQTLEFILRQAEPYSLAGSYGGYQNELSGSITVEAGRQDYDLTTELVDQSGTPLFNLGPSGSLGSMRVTEVFHFSPAVAFRFFDSTAAINYLNNEFSFESFTPETVFYVLPVFEDLLRQGQMQLSQRVRRSNYSYRIIGRKLRIFPTPSSRLTNTPRKIWVRVQFPLSPFGVSGSLGTTDQSIYGISNISNIPYGNLPYNTINSFGANWIREYTLALCMITLGFIRGKVRNIPIPNSDVQLNYDDLLTRGYEGLERLETQLRERLENLTVYSLIEKEADKAENLQRQLRTIPNPNGWMIIVG